MRASHNRIFNFESSNPANQLVEECTRKSRLLSKMFFSNLKHKLHVIEAAVENASPAERPIITAPALEAQIFKKKNIDQYLEKLEGRDTASRQKKNETIPSRKILSNFRNQKVTTSVDCGIKFEARSRKLMKKDHQLWSNKSKSRTEPCEGNIGNIGVISYQSIDVSPNAEELNNWPIQREQQNRKICFTRQNLRKTTLLPSLGEIDNLQALKLISKQTKEKVTGSTHFRAAKSHTKGQLPFISIIQERLMQIQSNKLEGWEHKQRQHYDMFSDF